ncbi:hypothetical protein M0802_010079 [Mischocyttarus mexicanus]|nr:hypothetical protein M0802_010079 [Mischocyttarus mexicanus]
MGQAKNREAVITSDKADVQSPFCALRREFTGPHTSYRNCDGTLVKGKNEEYLLVWVVELSHRKTGGIREQVTRVAKIAECLNNIIWHNRNIEIKAKSRIYKTSIRSIIHQKLDQKHQKPKDHWKQKILPGPRQRLTDNQNKKAGG